MSLSGASQTLPPSRRAASRGCPEPEANPAVAEIGLRPFGIFEIRQCPPSPDVGKVGAALRFDENSAVFHEAETAGEIEDFPLRDIWIEIEPQRAKRGNIRDRGERDEIADPRIGLVIVLNLAPEALKSESEFLLCLQ